MQARYAIYCVPEPQSILAGQGSALLGRDSESGVEIPQSVVPGFSRERLRAITTDARRYGLHATLKAPFFLKTGLSEAELLVAAERFVLGRAPLTLPRLLLARIGGFFAMTPAGERPEEQAAMAELNTLAAEAVSFFDPFRAAPSEEETARRKPHTLSARQREHLAVWGYPYVFDEYRFHMTLTDAIRDPAEVRRMEDALRDYFATAHPLPLSIADIAVCRQYPDSASKNFTLLRRFRF